MHIFCLTKNTQHHLSPDVMPLHSCVLSSQTCECVCRNHMRPCSHSLAQQSRNPRPSHRPVHITRSLFSHPSTRRMVTIGTPPPTENTHSHAAQVFTTIIGMRSRSQRRCLSRQPGCCPLPSPTRTPRTHPNQFNILLKIYKYARIAHGISPVRTRDRGGCDYATTSRSHETYNV